MSQSQRQVEYDAIRSGVGMRRLDDRLIVAVRGDDRVSFLHGMCTADIKGLIPGRLVRTLFLTEHAHVIADCFIYGLQEESLWLEVGRSRWPVLRAHLERFLVADDVEFEELDALAVLDVEGPASREVMEVASSEARDLSQWHHLTQNGLRIANLPRYAGPAFTIIADCMVIPALVEQLRRSGREICELSLETIQSLRIERGLALVGQDTNERTLALEARLEPAIAFNKGCYVGQETIERASARGSLKRLLSGLRITGAEMPSLDAAIRLEGKEVGRLTSVADSPAAGIIGLAILHHSAWAPGTSVSIDGIGGVKALVCELPLERPSTDAPNQAQI
jgi:folate-binding protein YgfZ